MRQFIGIIETKSIVSLANNWSEIINKDILYDQKEGTGKGEWSGYFP